MKNTPAEGISPGLTSKGNRPGRKPGQPNGQTRRLAQALSAAVRERFGGDGAVLVEYWLAIAAGHGQAKIISHDEDGDPCQPYVTWPETGELSATPERIDWAVTQLRQAGWGMPAQHHVIEGEIRSINSSMVVTADMGQLTPARIDAMRALLRPAVQTLGPTSAGALAAPTPRPASELEAVEAEFTESPAEPAAISGPEGADSDDEMSKSGG